MKVSRKNDTRSVGGHHAKWTSRENDTKSVGDTTRKSTMPWWKFREKKTDTQSVGDTTRKSTMPWWKFRERIDTRPTARARASSTVLGGPPLGPGAPVQCLSASGRASMPRTRTFSTPFPSPFKILNPKRDVGWKIAFCLNLPPKNLPPRFCMGWKIFVPTSRNVGFA